ncbi:PilZ domain-containing protein [Rhizorhabdus dicambivorans]|uniref:PilZ domain-containing protein n=1 Tax=Rhizorhabdus dicambivorans TaxID=1850238 RepID=A0A2A4G3J5_9SPHN|nr:PilZ domain-containing protein [Rhizorhabdus dicambivorans]ATE65069.1 PilZ domain-containing protein [Rhizorhabdus dicambivorans]PCE44343.1 PilZ domain-containing protein [Rhizorhabdus dicambivorans]
MAFAGEQQNEDARRYGRHRIMLAATFYSVHGEANGVLLDVSQGGAMLSASPPPPVGCRLLLERQNFDVPGVVRWVEGNRFGVQFEEMISEDEVLGLVSKSGPNNDR